MKTFAKALLTPFYFVGGTAEQILYGAGDILGAASSTISNTLMGGSTRVAQLFNDNTDSPSALEAETRSDPFQNLRMTIDKASANYNRKLIDNAEEIQKTIQVGAEMGVDKLVVQCTKKFGAEVTAGVPIKGLPIQVTMIGQSKKACLIEVLYKPDTGLKRLFGFRRLIRR